MKSHSNENNDKTDYSHHKNINQPLLLYQDENIVLIENRLIPTHDKSLDSSSSSSILYNIKQIAIESIPVSLNLLFLFLIETINISFIGSISNPVLLNSVGLGNSFFNLFGSMPVIYLQGGIDTLCSISYGNRKYNHIGVYVSIGRIVTLVYILLVYVPLSLYSKSILKLISIEEDISQYSSEYIYWMIPCLIFIGQREILIRYLQSILIFKPAMIVSFITFVLHPIWAYVFIIKYDFRLKGAAISLAFTQFLNFTLLQIYVLYGVSINSIKKPTFKWISKETFQWMYIKEYLYYSIPLSIHGFIDSLSFEMLIIISSVIGLIESSATICLFNFICIVYYFLQGISLTISNFIGNAVGKENPLMIKVYIKSGIVYSCLISIILIVFCVCFRYQLALFYSHNSQVNEMFINLLPFYLIFLIVDNMNIILYGILKGLGRQKNMTIFASFIFFLVYLPDYIIFSFMLNLGIYGLWTAQIINIFIMFTSEMYVLYNKSIETSVYELNNE